MNVLMIEIVENIIRNVNLIYFFLVTKNESKEKNCMDTTLILFQLYRLLKEINRIATIIIITSKTKKGYMIILRNVVLQIMQLTVQVSLRNEKSTIQKTCYLNNPNNSTHTATKSGNTLLGVVVTSMTSGVLYKVKRISLIHMYYFTPLGTILRNAFRWNNNNMSNINGGYNRVYGYPSESFNPYSGEKHYIGYILISVFNSKL
ncbi:CYIR protein [Plasmodium cynomolgi strain B]|uniref:CYIR protein n=1 Tax=Plasmodium cynomolgi (strain B) TaxID=1120755 RepID=K6V0G2_PLACD|nr:CYIR protein [Plasmodium cynomolgi strain B]GAB69819.1 CYIR protein [Plasmodium cynomolgi strain B]